MEKMNVALVLILLFIVALNLHFAGDGLPTDAERGTGQDASRRTCREVVVTLSIVAVFTLGRWLRTPDSPQEVIERRYRAVLDLTARIRKLKTRIKNLDDEDEDTGGFRTGFGSESLSRSLLEEDWRALSQLKKQCKREFEAVVGEIVEEYAGGFFVRLDGGKTLPFPLSN